MHSLKRSGPHGGIRTRLKRSRYRTFPRAGRNRRGPPDRVFRSERLSTWLPSTFLLRRTCSSGNEAVFFLSGSQLEKKLPIEIVRAAALILETGILRNHY